MPVTAAFIYGVISLCTSLWGYQLRHEASADRLPPPLSGCPLAKAQIACSSLDVFVGYLDPIIVLEYFLGQSCATNRAAMLSPSRARMPPWAVVHALRETTAAALCVVSAAD